MAKQGVKNPIKNRVVLGPLDPIIEQEPRQGSKPNLPVSIEYKLLFELDWNESNI